MMYFRNQISFLKLVHHDLATYKSDRTTKSSNIIQFVSNSEYRSFREIETKKEMKIAT